MTPKPDGEFVTRRELDTELRLRDRAVDLQATEYERRLQGLNHENERISAVLANSVPREKYDDDRKSDAAAMTAALSRANDNQLLIQAALDDIRNQLSRAKGIAAVGVPLLLLVGGVVSRLLGG